MQAVRRYASLAALATLGACTDAELYIPLGPDSPYMRFKLEGVVCAPPQVTEPVPYKVLFVIDTSFSNSWTDPGTPPRREQAVRNAISANITNPNVSFGVITFSDSPRRQTFGFTRDLTVLNGAVANIASAQGGTNYSDTLWTMIDFIFQDLAQITAEEALLTHYLVFWLSDGYPTVGVTETDSLLPGVDYLRESLEKRCAEFRLNTAFLGGGPTPSTPEEQQALADAINLLTEEASRGNGTFTDIPAGQSPTFSIDAKPMVRNYVLASVVANNQHARFGSEHPLPDSDADGLHDDLEDKLGLDPQNRDSDGDGLGDGVEDRLRPRYDPGESDAICVDMQLDGDGDDLLDCEEVVLGTAGKSFDTDGDTLPDGIEVLLGSDPNSQTALADTDLDGWADDFEVRAHLLPRETTGGPDVDMWSYQYETRDAPVQNGSQCYEVGVTNVGGYETLPVEHAPAGRNIIDLVIAFRVDTGTGPIRYERHQAEVRYVFPDIQDPPSGIKSFTPADFGLLPLSVP